MDWEPQEHEFVNHDATTILVRVEQDGTVEVTYFDYDAAVAQHVIEQFTDQGRVHSLTVTRIRPGEHLPSFEADVP